MGIVRRFATTVAGCAAIATTVPALGQFSDSFNFIKAVRDRDGTKVMPLINQPGSPVLNTRDSATGETALHIVTRGHDMTWLGFLLGKGAQTEIKDRDGATPLLAAAQTGDADAARLLLAAGARVNASNNRGETPLVLAVHNRDLPLARQLVANGGNPDQKDTIAGKSARDYATEDRRGAALLKILDDAKPAKPATGVAGPTR